MRMTLRGGARLSWPKNQNTPTASEPAVQAAASRFTSGVLK